MSELNDAKQEIEKMRQEIERLRKIILEQHKESERWRRFNFDRAGYPSSDWHDIPPPI